MNKIANKQVICEVLMERLKRTETLLFSAPTPAEALR